MLRCVVRLRFSKMHGQGNDFVVIDGVRQRVALSRDQVRALADRHFGIGCDQLLLVEPAREAGNDFRYRIFNADGGEVEQCGNGARCFARFVRDEGLTAKRRAPGRDRPGGVIRPRIEPSGQVTVDMGPPRFEPARGSLRRPRAAAHLHARRRRAKAVELSVLSMGNPHAVQIVADVDRRRSRRRAR